MQNYILAGFNKPFSFHIFEVDTEVIVVIWRLYEKALLGWHIEVRRTKSYDAHKLPLLGQ